MTVDIHGNRKGRKKYYRKEILGSDMMIDFNINCFLNQIPFINVVKLYYFFQHVHMSLW